MREILFRGKRISTGEWVYGFFYHPKISGKTYIVYNDGTAHQKEVLPETVGQYTGLTDKNGKQIFEGDICNTMICDMTTKYTTGIVCYDSMGMLSLKCQDGAYDDFFVHLHIGCPDDYWIEVIGNTTNNHELIGGVGDG